MNDRPNELDMVNVLGAALAVVLGIVCCFVLAWAASSKSDLGAVVLGLGFVAFNVLLWQGVKKS